MTTQTAAIHPPTHATTEDKRWQTPLWFALATFSLPPAGLLANTVAGSVDSPGSGALAGAIAGVVIGTAQWFALRDRVPAARRWVPATAVGLALGLAAGTAAVDAGTSGSDLAISGAITGLVMGAAQYLVLRPSSKRALAWIPVAAAGWSLGWLTTWAAGVNVEEGWSNFGAAGVVVFGAIAAAAMAFIRPEKRSAR